MLHCETFADGKIDRFIIIILRCAIHTAMSDEMHTAMSDEMHTAMSDEMHTAVSGLSMQSSRGKNMQVPYFMHSQQSEFDTYHSG